MQITSWADLLGKLDTALMFARDLGLGDRLQGSRFTAFRNRIATLTGVLDRQGDAATLDAFTQDAELNGAALAGLIWVGECKRPYDLDTVSKNLSRAYEQLNHRLAGEPLAARGLIAISLSRPLAARSSFLEYGHLEGLRATLKERVSEMVRLMTNELRELRSYRPGRVGLLMTHIIVPAWDHSRQIPTTVQYSAGTDTSEDGSHDGRRLWDAISRTFGES